MSKEILDFKNPKILAVEAAAFALLALRLKSSYDRRHDKSDASEPLPYPLHDVVDRGEVYVYTDEEGVFSVGAIDPSEGYIEVQGKSEHGPDGEAQIVIDDERSEKDPLKLEVLRARFKKLSDQWANKVNP
jgi:hypothetical protein